MEVLKIKYEKNLQELDRNIPMLQQMIVKPFEKGNELAQLKKDISKLEREITIKIQANQMKQQPSKDAHTCIIKETPVVIMDTKNHKTENSLLPKNDIGSTKKRGLSM